MASLSLFPLDSLGLSLNELKASNKRLKQAENSKLLACEDALNSRIHLDRLITKF